MSIKKKTGSRLSDAQLNDAVNEVADLMDSLFHGWSKDPSTEDTPRRFVEYLAEYTQPINLDKLFKSFERPKGSRHQIVCQTNIPFRGVCEHHLLPMWGTASLAYIPSSRVIGLSKMVRLVQAVGTEKPSLQEMYADRIVNLMEEHLDPQGTALVIRSEHSCMACRGVAAPNVPTITSTMSGTFLANPAARTEFMHLVQLGDNHVK